VRTLSRYLLARFFGLFVIILITSTVVLVTIELMLSLNGMIPSGAGPEGPLASVFLRLPSAYARYLVPISAFSASFFCVALTAYQREILAMKSGGISLLRLLSPLAASAALLGLVVLIAHDVISIRAARSSEQSRAGSLSVTFADGSFWYHRGKTIYNVGEVDGEGRSMRSVRLFERGDDGRLVRTILADRAEVEDADHWRFEAAVIRTFSPEDPTHRPTLRREPSIVLPISGGANDLALMGARLDALTLMELQRHIEVRQSNGSDVRHAATLLHSRLCDAAGVFALALMALPLGLRSEQTRSLSQPAVLAVGALVAYFSLRSSGAVLSEAGILPPGAGSWLVLVLYSAVGVLVFARSSR